MARRSCYYSGEIAGKNMKVPRKVRAYDSRENEEETATRTPNEIRTPRYLASKLERAVLHRRASSTIDTQRRIENCRKL